MFRRKKSHPAVIIEDAAQPVDSLQKKNWFKRHKKWTIVIIIAGILAVAGGTTAALILLNKEEPAPAVVAPAPEPEPEPVIYYSPLTGAIVPTEADTTQPVTAIMIENSPDARPQSGLKESGVVFEAIAEGGITRFLALYQEQKPKLIGPVRSLRMYYVDWLAPFNASVAHVGGSANSLKEIRNGKYRDIDQFFNDSTYWRATDRYAPHNVYTNFERIDALNERKGYTSSEFTSFKRKDSEPATAPTATSVDVKISSATYNSAYTFNTKTGLYDRSQGGAAHQDRESGRISPRVVIVMKVQQRHIFEDGWREQIDAIGSGTAHIFQDGTEQTVTWKKASREGQVTFTDADGEEVALARGQTWITAIPNGVGSVSWK